MIPYAAPKPPPFRKSFVPGVEEASWLRDTFLRGGSKGGSEISDIAKGMRKEGATPSEIYKETNKYVDPRNETGLMEMPGGGWAFQIPDNKMMLTPTALSYFRDIGGGGDTGVQTAERLMKHDLLYDYNPDMRKVHTEITQLAPGDTMNSQGWYASPLDAPGAGTPMGKIRVYGEAGKDPNSYGENTARSILAHEIQHPLQWQMGMPEGDSPDNPALHRFFNEKVVPRAGEMKQMLTEHYRKFSEADPENPNNFSMWQAAHPEKAALLNEVSRVGGYSNPRSAIPGQRPMTDAQRYFMSAGEQRAMQAARHSNLDAEGLRANDPTQFIPFEQGWRGKTGALQPLQIIRRGREYSLDKDLPYYMNTMKMAE